MAKQLIADTKALENVKEDVKAEEPVEAEEEKQVNAVAVEGPQPPQAAVDAKDDEWDESEEADDGQGAERGVAP